MQNIQIESGVIRAKECLREADKLIQPKYALFVGMSLIVALIPIGLYYIPIPYIGCVLSLASSGPLICCLYLAILKQSRNELPNFSIFFTEFPKYLKTIPITILESIPMYLLDLFSWFSNTADQAPIISSADNFTDNQSILYLLISILVSLIILTILMFALPLIVDRDRRLSEAIVLSAKGVFANPGGIISLVVIQGLMLFFGVVACGIGFFLALPVCYAMTVVAYLKIYPFSPPVPNNEPPSPHAYGDTYGSAKSI